MVTYWKLAVHLIHLSWRVREGGTKDKTWFSLKMDTIQGSVIALVSMDPRSEAQNS